MCFLKQFLDIFSLRFMSLYNDTFIVIYLYIAIYPNQGIPEFTKVFYSP